MNANKQNTKAKMAPNTVFVHQLFLRTSITDSVSLVNILNTYTTAWGHVSTFYLNIALLYWMLAQYLPCTGRTGNKPYAFSTCICKGETLKNGWLRKYLSSPFIVSKTAAI